MKGRINIGFGGNICRKEATWEFYTSMGEENVDMKRADWNNMAWDRNMWRAF
jgi:hypothetical protein